MTGFLYSRLDGDNKTIYEMVVGFIDKHGFSSVGVVVGVTLRVGEITDVYKVAKYNSFCEKYHKKRHGRRRWISKKICWVV